MGDLDILPASISDTAIEGVKDYFVRTVTCNTCGYSMSSVEWTDGHLTTSNHTRYKYCISCGTKLIETDLEGTPRPRKPVVKTYFNGDDYTTAILCPVCDEPLIVLDQLTLDLSLQRAKDEFMPFRHCPGCGTRLKRLL